MEGHTQSDKISFSLFSFHSLSQLTSILALAVLSLNFIYLLFIGQSRHPQHTCGQRQLWRAGLLLQSRVWGSNSGHQVWQQAPYQLSHLRRFSCTSHLGSSYSISYHQLLTCLSFRYVWVPTCQSLAGRRNPNWIKRQAVGKPWTKMDKQADIQYNLSFPIPDKTLPER